MFNLVLFYTKLFVLKNRRSIRISNIIRMSFKKNKINLRNIINNLFENNFKTKKYYLFTQLLLLQESWKELFLLHLAQWSIPWDLSPLLNSEKARERLPADDLKVNNEMKIIQEILARFRQLSPDGSECGCMKAVILFTPGECRNVFKSNTNQSLYVLQGICSSNV